MGSDVKSINQEKNTIDEENAIVDFPMIEEVLFKKIQSARIYKNFNYFFIFSTEAAATEYLRALVKFVTRKKVLDSFFATNFCAVMATHAFNNQEETEFEIVLTPDQLQYLNEGFSEWKNIPRSETFLIKNIRGDEDNFFSHFLKTIIRDFTHTKNPPLRLGEKKKYTVKGDGCYDRSNRVPHFDQALKKHFSKAQSTSLVEFPNVQPPIFHFSTNQKDKAVAFIFNYGDNPTPTKLPYALLDRLFVFDAGTVTRPYDFETRQEANEYFIKKVEKDHLLFSDVAAFKAVLNPRDYKSNYRDSGRYYSNHYNEVLARLRWDTDGTSKIAISNDNFEARCLAQAYATSLQKRLQKLAQPSDKTFDINYEVPICFYSPYQPKHMKPYSVFQRVEDKTRAEKIYKNEINRKTEYSTHNYEFLLLIDDLAEGLKEAFLGKPLLFNIIEEGYGHIAELLLEKNNDPSFFETLIQQYSKQGYDFTKIYSEATRKNNVNWAKLLVNNKASLSPKNDLILLACKKTQWDVIRVIAEAKVALNVNGACLIKEKKLYPLIEMIKSGDIDLIQKILENNADANIGKISSIHPYGYFDIKYVSNVSFTSKHTYAGTALWVAMRDKHYEIVKLLLEHNYKTNAHTMIAPVEWVYSWLGYPEKETCPISLRLRIEYLTRISNKVSDGQDKGLRLTDSGIAFLLGDPLCLKYLNAGKSFVKPSAVEKTEISTAESLLTLLKAGNNIKPALPLTSTEHLMQVYSQKLKPHCSKLVLEELLSRRLTLTESIVIASKENFNQLLDDLTKNPHFSQEEMQEIKVALANNDRVTLANEMQTIGSQDFGFFSLKAGDAAESCRIINTLEKKQQLSAIQS
ncbi:MAG: ankyrin repeat domain-containing protein [Legionella sp.]|nr:ankyrin repeat domain-containing protein [Legionella sp.]